MSEERDDRLHEFLNAAAPPPHDPLFRLRVLELREELMFRRRFFIMLAAALVIVLMCLLAFTIGGKALETIGALVVGTALAGGYLAFRGRALEILRRYSL